MLYISGIFPFDFTNINWNFRQLRIRTRFGKVLISLISLQDLCKLTLTRRSDHFVSVYIGSIKQTKFLRFLLLLLNKEKNLKCFIEFNKFRNYKARCFYFVSENLIKFKLFIYLVNINSLKSYFWCIVARENYMVFSQLKILCTAKTNLHANNFVLCQLEFSLLIRIFIRLTIFSGQSEELAENFLLVSRYEIILAYEEIIAIHHLRFNSYLCFPVIKIKTSRVFVWELNYIFKVPFVFNIVKTNWLLILFNSS